MIDEPLDIDTDALLAALAQMHTAAAGVWLVMVDILTADIDDESC